MSDRIGQLFVGAAVSGRWNAYRSLRRSSTDSLTTDL